MFLLHSYLVHRVAAGVGENLLDRALHGACYVI